MGLKICNDVIFSTVNFEWCEIITVEFLISYHNGTGAWSWSKGQISGAAYLAVSATPVIVSCDYGKKCENV